MPDQTPEPLSDYHATTQRFASLLVAITTALGEPGDTLFGDLPRLVAEQCARVKELEAQAEESRRGVGAARGYVGALQARVMELQSQVAARDARITELEAAQTPPLGYIAMAREKNADGPFGILLTRNLATDKLSAEMQRERFAKDEDMHVIIAELREVSGE